MHLWASVIVGSNANVGGITKKANPVITLIVEGVVVKEYKEKLLNAPCECASCLECGGSGDVWYSFSNKYLGNHRCDDLDTLECCDECGGSGVDSICQRCKELEEIYEEEEYERELEERKRREW